MSEKSSFFDSQLQGDTYDRIYKAEDFANYFSTFIGNGIFANPSNNLQVTSEEGTPTKFGMPIIVKKGKAFINGYFYENTDDLTLLVSIAHGTLKRIDRVVLRLDYINREIKAYILEGTPSASPIAPSITRDADKYELVLADILVDSGVTILSNANVTDKRQDSSLCGIVKGIVEEIDTTDLFNQFTTVFQELKEEEKQTFEVWFNEIKGNLTTDQATNLQNQLDRIHNDNVFKIKNYLKNGDFNTTNNWTYTDSTFTVENNIGNVATEKQYTGILQSMETIPQKGDKIYTRATIKSNNIIRLNILGYYFLTSGNGEYENISGIVSQTTTTGNIAIQTTETNGGNFQVKKVATINLTEVFGVGNEPTKEEMDRIMTYYNGFIDDTEHLLDRNNKVNTDFFNNKIIIPKLEVKDGLGVTKQNNTFKDYFYFNTELDNLTNAYHGTIGLKHYDATVNDTSYMGFIFNKTATTTDEIIPFENNSTSLGKQGNGFRDIFIGNSSINENGYTKLTNGLILQWGYVTTDYFSNANRNQQVEVVFPIAFPNKALITMSEVSANNSTGSATYIADLNSNIHCTEQGKAVIDMELLGSLGEFSITYKLNWFSLGY